MESRLNTNRDWEQELRLEMMESLFDFFFGTFHLLLQKRGHITRKAFTTTKLLDTDVPVCSHPQVFDYIETSTKKLMSLLITNRLEGVEFLILERMEVVERFVITLNGEFGLNSIFNSCDNISSAKIKIMELKSTLKETLLRLKTFEQDPNAARMKGTRFRIVLGLVTEYLEKADGPFENDSDQYAFPWSAPKSRFNDSTGNQYTGDIPSPIPNESIRGLDSSSMEQEESRDSVPAVAVATVFGNLKSTEFDPRSSPGSIFSQSKGNKEAKKFVSVGSHSSCKQRNTVPGQARSMRSEYSARISMISKSALQAPQGEQLVESVNPKPILKVIDSLTLCDTLLVNIYGLFYKKPVSDTTVIHRRPGPEEARRFSGLKSYTEKASSLALLQSSAYSPSRRKLNLNSSSPTSSIATSSMQHDARSLYHRPVLSSSRSLGQNLRERAGLSPSFVRSTPGHNSNIINLLPMLHDPDRVFSPIRRKMTARRRL